jgi:hypothetical protein
VVWTGTLGRIKADTFTNGPNISEIVFDKTWVFNQAAESQSGMAEVFLNGTSLGTLPWSVSTFDGGSALVTVPAGTFTTRKWNGTLSEGTFSETFSSFVASHTEISRQENPAGSVRLLELASGNVTSLSSGTSTDIGAVTLLLNPERVRQAVGIP